MFRVLVVACAVAGCFSKPGLHGDGGFGGDGGDDGGGTSDGAVDSPPIDGPPSIANCTWAHVGAIVDGVDDERAPWLSHDGTVLVFWQGDARGAIYQSTRATVNEQFGAPSQIYPAAGDSPDDPDPALSADMMTMYFKSSSGGIVKSTRTSLSGSFGSPVQDAALNNMFSMATGRTVFEGPWISPDELTFMFVAGTGTYESEDLYISTRTSSTAAWGAPQLFPHNVSDANECCPTAYNDVVMYERPSAMGHTEIVQSQRTVTQTFTVPTSVLLPGSDSWQQPALSGDGQRLVYAVYNGSAYHLEEAKVVCP